jgi:putative radical SAM enzyme (TIGR03279 family)
MMEYSGHLIKSVEKGSIADEMGVEAGDALLSIDDMQVEDVFDYRFLVQSDELTVLIRKEDGEEWELEIEKDETEDLGIEFESGLMDEYRSCRNKCIFCFIDQMPEGMRPTLYFKDDDSRLSFLQGNYVTLTNMDDHDIDRIIRYRLSPINISVHTTNPELRCEMLNNRFAGEALSKIKRLYDAGIVMNGQIVLCKGVNDKDELRRTLYDLLEYAPLMQSVSVVPVGLTKYRKGLYPLMKIEKEDALSALTIIDEVAAEAYSKFGIHFAHASDEIYILAGRPFPESDEYDDYPQLENGVGMLRLMHDEYESAYVKVEEDCKKGKIDPEKYHLSFSVATGVLAKDYVHRATSRICSLFPNVTFEVYAIRNDFFGEDITVAGLITGGDIISQLREVKLGEHLLIPDCMMKKDEDIFLDNTTLADLESTLQVKTHIVKSNGLDLVDFIMKEGDYE